MSISDTPLGLARNGQTNTSDSPVKNGTPSRRNLFFHRRPGSDPYIAPFLFTILIAALEFTTIALLGYAVSWLYLGAANDAFSEYLFPVPLLAFCAVAVFQALSLYAPSVLRHFPKGFPRLLLGWGMVFLLAFATIFFLKLEGVFSRVVFAVWFAVGLCVLILGRFAAARLALALSMRGIFRQRAVLIGGGAEADAFLSALDLDADHDLELLGIFDDRSIERSPPEVKGLKKLGSVEDLSVFVRKEAVDVAIFTVPVVAEGRILDMLRALCVLPIDIRLAAHSQKLRFQPRHYLFFGALPAFSILDRPVAGFGLLQKILFDRVLGALILIALAPLMAIIALVVKLDSAGPVLFRQTRFGFNNEPIEVFKFRSMYTEQCDVEATHLVTRNDSRVTRVGKFIRRTSLDELPQLFNVVFYGNLSLVGPRPHALRAKTADKLYEEVIDVYFARHRVKPGMTGWAQVNGWRGETDTDIKLQRRVEHDLYYIENWSIAFDLGIVLMTPLAVVRGENAY